MLRPLSAASPAIRPRCVTFRRKAAESYRQNEPATARADWGEPWSAESVTIEQVPSFLEPLPKIVSMRIRTQPMASIVVTLTRKTGAPRHMRVATLFRHASAHLPAN